MEVACVLAPEVSPAAGPGGGTPPPEGLWEGVLRRLEEVGAAVESERLGEAFFAVDGLRGIHGGDTAGVLTAAREAAAIPVRIGVAPTRFGALMAASGRVGPLASLPLASLRGRLGLPEREAAGRLETMRRLGIATLGELAALPAALLADRFGPAGLRAHRLARGEDELLRPRRPHEEVAAEVELPEGTAGDLLDSALALLVDRFLAVPERRGRTVLGLRLGARLGDGGSWSVEQGLGRPTAAARALRAVLTPRLEELPAPAVSLRLRAVGLGPRAADQLELALGGEDSRRRRIGAAVREVRAAQGPESLLKVLPLDVDSRVPERRVTLAPHPEL